MASFATCTSSDLRNQGRELFLQAFENPPKKSIGNRIEYAKEAMKLFCRSYVAASEENNQNDWISAKKNYAVTSRKLASMTEFQEINKSNPEIIHYYFKEASKSGLECVEKGIECGMNQEWMKQMDEHLIMLTRSLIQFIQIPNKLWRKRCGEIHPYFKIFEKKNQFYLQTFLYVSVANECLKGAILSCENDHWNEGLQCINEMYQYLQFAKRFHSKIKQQNNSNYIKISEEIKDLSHSHDIYQCRFQSSQFKFQGDEAKRTLLQDIEDLNMDLAFIVVDFYKQAILQTKYGDSNCFESEAINSATLGAFYHQILKSDQVGHVYLMNSINIVDNITQTTGITYFNQTWYQNAKTLIEEYRQKQFCFDQENIRQRRAPTLEILKPKLDAMEEAMSSFDGRLYRCHALLTHLYNKEPPKNGTLDLTKLDKDSMKSLSKACVKAVAHYHTDKPFNKEPGIEWYILCEEICKKLNYFVSEFKNMS